MERDQNPTREKARTNQTLLTGAEEMKMKNVELVFDNGGGLTIQCDDFVHNYDDMIQAAQDYKLLCTTDDVSDWEGNDTENRIDYSDDQLRNGGYRVFCTPQELDRERRFGWRNIDDFQHAYFGTLYLAND